MEVREVYLGVVEDQNDLGRQKAAQIDARRKRSFRRSAGARRMWFQSALDEPIRDFSLALWRAGSSFVERELVAIRTLGLPVRRSQSMVNWHVGWHMKVIMGLAILISFLALSIFLTAFLLAAR